MSRQYLYLRVWLSNENSPLSPVRCALTNRHPLPKCVCSPLSKSITLRLSWNRWKWQIEVTKENLQHHVIINSVNGWLWWIGVSITDSRYNGIRYNGFPISQETFFSELIFSGYNNGGNWLKRKPCYLEDEGSFFFSFLFTHISEITTWE